MKTTLKIFTLLLLSLGSFMSYAQAPNLGTAASFVLFSTNGAVSNSGISHLTGNVGTNNGSNTAFGNVDGVMHSANGTTAQAAADLLIAYNQLNATIANYFPSNLLGNGDTLLPGVYQVGSAATLNGVLTLNANNNPGAVFIFKIQGSLSTSANSKVRIINGGRSCNVFWKVEGLVSMASGTHMKGTVIANNAAINMNTGDTLEGRALSTTGAVTLNGVKAYTPLGCGTPTLTGPAAPNFGTAAAYALFSSNGQVSNTGSTFVTGDVGTNVGTTTGYDSTKVTGTIHSIPDSSTSSAAADLSTAYSYLNTLSHDIELLYPAQFGRNLVLTPHTYLLNAATVLTDSLYLNAQGNANAVFVIKINGALSTNTYSKVILINGAQPQNVYWKIEGAVSIATFSTFRGSIVVNNGALGALDTGVTIFGRVLTTGGALSTTGMTITIPGTTPVLNDLIISTTTGVEGSYNNVTVTSTGNGTLTNNLIVMGSMIVQPGGKFNTGGNLVQGNNAFTLGTQSTLTMHSANGINTTGSLGDIRVAGTRTFSAAATYIYAGNVPQTTGTALPSTVDSVVINNISGVSLLASHTINRKLTLGNGNLNLGNFSLTIAPAATIVGASASGYIGTEGASATGTLNRTVTTAGAAVLFPVGSSTWKGSYTPATLSMPAGTTDVLSVRAFRGVFSAGMGGAAVTSHAVNRSWVITEAVTGGSVATVQLQWNDTMELTAFNRNKTGIARHNGTSWDAPAAVSYVAATGTNPYSTSRAGITSFSVFVVGDSVSNASLPVEMTRFTAVQSGSDVVLSWQTASESNNSHFEIERSSDAVTYTSAGMQPGAGNSFSPISYTFTDMEVATGAKPVMYYRLKQVDFDGQSAYFGPVAVQFASTSKDAVLSAFPNPFVNSVAASINDGMGGPVELTITDLQGKTVATAAYIAGAGSASQELGNLDRIPVGIYILTASTNGQIYRQKIVKTAQ